MRRSSDTEAKSINHRKQISPTLHPLPLNTGDTSEVTVQRVGPRRFHLSPWPFDARELSFRIPARWIEGTTFTNPADVQAQYSAAETVWIPVEIVA